MSVHPETQPSFPFLVEPVSSEQVQLWAQFASQASTPVDFCAVQEVFNAFCYASWFYEWVQRAQPYLQNGDIVRAVNNLDYGLKTLGWLIETWQKVTFHLHNVMNIATTNQWYQDAYTCWQSTQAIRHVVVTYVLSACSFYGWDIPEYTQAFLVAQQSQQPVSQEN